MSMKDIKTEIQFGASVAVSREEIKQSKGDIIRYKQEQQARDLGLMIAEKKGWYMRDEGDLAISDIRLYVFTPNELKDFMDAKFKATLNKMADIEEYLSDHQREALRTLAERFW